MKPRPLRTAPKTIRMGFTDANVIAIREGRKTVTRRQLPKAWQDYNLFIEGTMLYDIGNSAEHAASIITGHLPGDVILVGETTLVIDGEPTLYRADLTPSRAAQWGAVKRWNRPTTMPNALCRYRLRIENVRVERLQDITREDALAEGIIRQESWGKEYNVQGRIVREYIQFQYADYQRPGWWIQGDTENVTGPGAAKLQYDPNPEVGSYATQWDALYAGAKKPLWADNPYVLRYEFSLLS